MSNFNHLFHGELVKLTGVRDEDFALMMKWGEDAEYLRNVDTDIAIPKTKQQFEAESTSSSNSFYFQVRTIQEDQLIGFVVIHSIEWNNRAGMLAIGIGEAKNRNKGYGTGALRLILRYAFHELNLTRVGLDVIDYNKRAIRAYEKVGFQQEGRLRSAVFRDGESYDRVLMGILYSEWLDMYK
ncbi:N-acetyltransferase [Heyndrickxia sporothermodurans]|nr:N-acetyltransferase [Heyndrickxia sporothermodurans]